MATIQMAHPRGDRHLCIAESSDWRAARCAPPGPEDPVGAGEIQGKPRTAGGEAHGRFGGGPRPGAGRQPVQEYVPGPHEPRVAHAAERDSWFFRYGAPAT